MHCGATHMCKHWHSKSKHHTNSEQPIVWSAMGLKACDRLLTFTSSSPPPTSLFSLPPAGCHMCSTQSGQRLGFCVCPLTKKGERDGKGCDESDREQEMCDSVSHFQLDDSECLRGGIFFKKTRDKISFIIKWFPFMLNSAERKRFFPVSKGQGVTQAREWIHQSSSRLTY